MAAGRQGQAGGQPHKGRILGSTVGVEERSNYEADLEALVTERKGQGRVGSGSYTVLN